MNSTLIKPLTAALIPVLIMISCKTEDSREPAYGSEVITALPMETVPMEKLAAFREPGDNWIIAGNAFSDYQTEFSMETENGTGILVNTAPPGEGAHLRSELEHGDIELKVEFMVPKNSNSGIYFQDRYELQILDSWLRDEPQMYDLGGIYERWDETRPEGERGYDGTAPLVNAALAPGLWQEFHVLFRAPRFDDDGHKTENARFEWVYLNGVKIQNNVEVTGPTRGGVSGNEVAKAPLRFQGDHGPVAFRNMQYKTYSQADSITLGPLQYQIVDYTGGHTPTDFENLELIAEGETRSFNVEELSPKDDHYASRFTGEFEVPVSGEYFFRTAMYNGGNLYINGELLIENTGEVEYYEPGNTIYLEEGTHTMEITHFQVVWMSYIRIDYEGPGMEQRPLARDVETDGRTQPPLIIEAVNEEPELIGGFFNYEGEKRTHTLTVGQPEGIHYTMDLARGSLLSFWRGPFADVTEMWQGRGHEQLLVPLNAAVESSAGVPLADRSGRDSLNNPWPDHAPGIQHFRMDEDGRPIFVSEWDGVLVKDRVHPADDGTSLVRLLSFRSEEVQNQKAARLAQGQSIELLPNGYYRINGRYYLEILSDGGADPEIIEQDESTVLLIPVLTQSGQTEIRYRLIW